MRPWVYLTLGLIVFANLQRVRIMTRKSGDRWDRLIPQAKALSTILVDNARARGLPVMFFEGWRDPIDEIKNIKAGTSKLSDPYNSLHTWGTAFDIVFVDELGNPYWPPASDPRWRQLALIGESLGLKSGGLMWGWDWPHFQLPGYKAADFRAQYGSNYLAFLRDEGVSV